MDKKVRFASNEIKNVLDELVLEQNYPNPVSKNTTIRFHIPGKGFTSLKVYNSTGHEIAFFNLK